MKKLSRILLWMLAVLAVLVVAGISFTMGWRPFIGPRARLLTAQKFETTPQRLERGQYLANGVSGCVYCHTEHDFRKADEPLPASQRGGGQVLPYLGLPGRVVANNLSSDSQTGAGSWTDDQLARAIREGIGHDGRALFPIMPYLRFHSMSDEDLASIVVYLRTLPPVHHELPSTEIVFPVKYLIRNAPLPLQGAVSAPDPADRMAYGKYLIAIGGCEDCHTPEHHGQAIPGMDFSGGFLLQVPGEPPAAAANLTTDASGIGYYDEALFLQAMRTGSVRGRKLSPLMPFAVYRNMSDDDLKAIFAYLRTAKAVHHRVDNTLPPTYCKLCQQKHGAGDQN
jgi:mono/diheme cytochrome c family protein